MKTTRRPVAEDLLGQHEIRNDEQNMTNIDESGAGITESALRKTRGDERDSLAETLQAKKRVAKVRGSTGVGVDGEGEGKVRRLKVWRAHTHTYTHTRLGWLS